MTIQELRELLDSVDVKTTQVTFTLGSKKFRVKEITWLRNQLMPVEIKLEEIKND